MKLLLDQNLSPRILLEIGQIYPGSIHVRDRNLQRSTDREVWEFAKNEGYAIVSKDADFHQRSLVFGYPPKVIWIRRGNCRTQEVIGILEIHGETICTFLADSESAFLSLR